VTNLWRICLYQKQSVKFVWLRREFCHSTRFIHDDSTRNVKRFLGHTNDVEWSTWHCPRWTMTCPPTRVQRGWHLTGHMSTCQHEIVPHVVVQSHHMSKHYYAMYPHAKAPRVTMWSLHNCTTCLYAIGPRGSHFFTYFFLCVHRIHTSKIKNHTVGQFIVKSSQNT